VLDRSLAAGDPAAIVESAVAAGVDWVQVRDRELDGGPLLALAERVREAARRGAARRKASARVIVNRRADVALASGVDGVHLGFDGMDAAQARAWLGPDALVGVSAHAPEEIDPDAGASYAHLAPIAAPLSKTSERPALGLGALAAAAARGLPVLAQGGIDAANAAAAIAAGAAGIAVTGAVLLADDPEQAVRALREALDERG
jgi:thiamine-phosphate pyrophosphorylase